MAMNERTVTVPLAHEVRGSGPVLVLVAGTGYPGATWRPSLVNLLAERTTVVTFDHRGTGTSAVGAAPFSTRLFAADLAALLDGLGIASAHVLGHSMGGRVIQWLALDRPDLVRSLILAATGPGQIDPGQPLVRGLPLITARELIEHGYHDYMKEHIADTFFTDEFIVESPEVVSDLVAAFWNNRPGLDAYLRHVIARQEHQTAERLAELSVASLVLVGDADTSSRGTGSHLAQSRYLADHLPDATLEVFQGFKHGYPWQAPERTADVLLKWVDRVERSFA